MARVTIEDCVEKVESRFELVALAAIRAKSIASGAALTIDRDDEKNSVLSLREIALGNVAVEDLREQLVQSYQKPSESDDLPEESSTAGEEEENLAEDAAAISEEMENPPSLEEAEEEALALEAAGKKTGAADDMFAEDNLDVDD